MHNLRSSFEYKKAVNSLEREIETEQQMAIVEKKINQVHSNFRELYPFQFTETLPLFDRKMKEHNATICSSYADLLRKIVEKSFPNVSTELLNVNGSLHHNFLVRDQKGLTKVFDVNTSNVEADEQGRYIWAEEIDKSFSFFSHPTDFYFVDFLPSKNKSEETLEKNVELHSVNSLYSRLFFLGMESYLRFKKTNNIEDLKKSIALNRKVLEKTHPQHSLHQQALANCNKMQNKLNNFYG
jgi:hypothetical protein